MPPLFGLFSWIVIGLAVGLSARLLPGEPPLGWAAIAVTGALGAFAGGMIATLLGFGGLAAFDLRSLTTAVLGAIVALLLLRGTRLA